MFKDFTDKPIHLEIFILKSYVMFCECVCVLILLNFISWLICLQTIRFCPLGCSWRIGHTVDLLSNGKRSTVCPCFAITYKTTYDLKRMSIYWRSENQVVLSLFLLWDWHHDILDAHFFADGTHQFIFLIGFQGCFHLHDSLLVHGLTLQNRF